MKYRIDNNNAIDIKSDCLVIGIFSDQALTPTAQSTDKASKGLLTRIIESGDKIDKKGSSLLLHEVEGIASKRILVMGCGKAEKFHEQEYLALISDATRTLLRTASVKAVFSLAELDVGKHEFEWRLRHLTETIEAAQYRFDQLKSQPGNNNQILDEAIFPLAEESPALTIAVATGQAIAAGARLAKDLANLPGNICTPSYLAEQAQTLAKEYELEATILEEADMEKLGMGALLSVSRGSRQPAKLITLTYSGGNKDTAPVVLVGKGLTFDAGGISIKPSANMDEMKYDMSGGASVLGTLKAIAELQLPVNVIGVIPSSENLPDGEANKPGDIVTSMSGQTIEILNTDAEGRLILCDALTYSKRFKPAVVIDIATLTGACVIALGAPASGLLANDDGLARELLTAGETAYDRAWQLPLWDAYQEQLDSNFADIANIGGRQAGTITAACFLSRFTKDFTWAHLDIAGTAWKTGKKKGATGRPVGLLTQYLINRAGVQA